MSDGSAIEWCDATWNVVRGCSRVSPGCEHCYAEGVAARFSGPGMTYEGLARRAPNGEARWTGTVRLVPEKLDEPLRWKKPRRIFVNSMSDLFHESLTFEEIAAVYAVMHAAPQHTFQVLTKRPARRLEFMRWLEERGGIGPYIRSMTVARKDEPEVARLRRPFDAITKTEVIDGRKHRARDDAWMTVFNAAAVTHKGPAWNIWEGVSVENQEAADERVPLLLQTPAAVRFLSVEPLLGPVNLDPPHCQYCPDDLEELGHAEDGTPWCMRCDSEMPQGWWLEPLDDEGKPLNGPAINWVIVGGESGPKARPMNPQWARDIRDQCIAAGVPCFFKQWGEYASVSEVEGPGAHYKFPDGRTVRRVGKKRAGRELDGREWNEFPKSGGA